MIASIRQSNGTLNNTSQSPVLQPRPCIRVTSISCIRTSYNNQCLWWARRPIGEWMKLFSGWRSTKYFYQLQQVHVSQKIYQKIKNQTNPIWGNCFPKIVNWTSKVKEQNKTKFKQNKELSTIMVIMWWGPIDPLLLWLLNFASHTKQSQYHILSHH